MSAVCGLGCGLVRLPNLHYGTTSPTGPLDWRKGESALPISLATLRTALESRYHIERSLGSGGMAIVFLATDLRHQRKVAIKVLRPEIATALGPDRFLREIGIVAQLAHPNIVPLYDSGEADGITYFVMPYVEGQSLRGILQRQGRLPAAEAIRIALEVADALEYAHRKDLVHRDIKPENVLLAAGHALVADFGIARAVHVASGETATTSSLVIGTPAYMSPEQATSASPIDRRSDVYSLGLVLYEMLAGELPSRAVTRQARVARPSLATANRTTRFRMPSAIQRVIARAIATDPTDRFGTAAEFATALRTAGERSLRRWTTAAVLSSLAMAVAGFAVYAALRSMARDAPRLSPRRIVIAPLANRTGTTAFDHLGQIAADWITGGLQQTGIVEIVPTETAAEAYRSISADSTGATGRDPVRALADQTGAGMVITGAYYLQDTTLLLRIQVSDALTGSLLEAPGDVATGRGHPIEGVVELRNRLMGWLAIHLDERLAGHSRSEEKPPTYAAYLAFSEGMSEYIATRNNTAVLLFLQAFAEDSTFSLALVYASIGLTNLGAFARADSVLRLAAPARSRLSSYHRAWLDSRIAFVAGRNDLALAAIRRAAELAPGSKAVYNQAVAAFQAGKVDEALHALETLSPERGPMRSFSPYWDLLGAIHHAKGDFRRELEVGRKAQRLHPERIVALLPVVRALAALGRSAELAEAVTLARRLPQDPIGFWNVGALLGEAGLELSAHGRHEGAVKALEQSIDWYRSNDRSPGGLWAEARTLYLLGGWSSARTLATRLLQSDRTNIEYRGLLGLMAARENHPALAKAVADSLAADRQLYSFGSASLYRARIAAVLGDRDNSVRLLRQSFGEGKEYDLWLHRDSDLDSLRGYPPFDRLFEFNSVTKH